MSTDNQEPGGQMRVQVMPHTAAILTFFSQRYQARKNKLSGLSEVTPGVKKGPVFSLQYESRFKTARSFTDENRQIVLKDPLNGSFIDLNSIPAYSFRNFVVEMQKSLDWRSRHTERAVHRRSKQNGSLVDQVKPDKGVYQKNWLVACGGQQRQIQYAIIH